MPLLVAAAALAGGQAAVFNTLHQSTLQSCVPEQLVARITSVNLLGSLTAVPLGLALAGPLAELSSLGLVLTAAAALAGTSTLAILCVRDIRNLTAFTAAEVLHPTAGTTR